MAKHHYIPASLLGRFSSARSGARRTRPIAALDASGQIVMTTPDELGHSNNLYDYESGQGTFESIDPSWTGIENRLQASLDQLAQNRFLPVQIWFSLTISVR